MGRTHLYKVFEEQATYGDSDLERFAHSGRYAACSIVARPVLTDIVLNITLVFIHPACLEVEMEVVLF